MIWGSNKESSSYFRRLRMLRQRTVGQLVATAPENLQYYRETPEGARDYEPGRKKLATSLIEKLHVQA